ncbi:hypothetical protein AJ80_05868 [Polytolypa hystricis UAMH7299]|uniref:MARVEL domain-containing protein n=1 Tax=Polytolypa hystricis (strain UAMH7299) TaxID=1447883 RepID=A0A2B7Y172_POLH7|nr:hypothetical protein AJ80_05868 [Polytolypa hystricis UAMH7299]
MSSSHGALGMTFKVVRLLQAACLIAIIGMTGNFIAQMVDNNVTPPEVIVGTISVMCIAVLYCAITFILFLDGVLPFLVITGLDTLHLVAVIVVAVVVGKPLSYLNCNKLGKGVDESSYIITTALVSNLDKNSGNFIYQTWATASKANCLEMKSIWGLSIALCILFAFSGICSACMWRQSKAKAPKDIEG